MKNVIFLLIATLLIFLSSSCKKEPPPALEPDLPPLTTEGKGTFGCYLNGEPWVAKWFLQAPGMPDYIEARYNRNLHVFVIDAIIPVDTNSLDKRMGIFIKSPNSGKVFLFPEFVSEYKHTALCGNREFYPDTLFFENSCSLSKFDLSEKIASGTFSFDLVNTECQDTVKVRDGRFDVRFTLIE